MKTDYAGDTIWTMVYGGNLKEECFSAVVLPSDGVAFAGFSASYGDSTQTYLFITDSLGFTGCNERRTQPVVFSPSFVQGNYSFNINSGITVNSPTSSQMITGTQQTSVCTPLAITDAVEMEIFFQNPVSETFELHSEKTMTRVCMYSANGQLLSDESVPGITSTMITAPDAAGMYVMIIYFADGTQGIRKLIVTEN